MRSSTSSTTPAASPGATRRITTKPASRRREALEFLPLLVELQDEPIADNVCIPLYFLARLVRQSGTTVVQVGEGADENWLGYWWCEHYRKKEVEVYAPARKAARSWFHRAADTRISLNTEDADIRRRAQAGQELFWGGAVCWWGGLREQLTPDPGPFATTVNCPVEGLLPEVAHAPRQPCSGQGLHRRAHRPADRARGDAEDSLYGNEATHSQSTS